MRPFTEGNIAQSFLTWQSRQEKSVVDFGKKNPEAMAGLRKDFIDYLSQRNFLLHDEDISAVVDAFARSNITFFDWYRCLLDSTDVDIDLADRTPKLPVKSLAMWRILTSRIDPDALITLALSETVDPHSARYRSSRISSQALETISRLSGWQTFVTCGDHGLENVLQAGVADTHVHLEACDPAPILWQRLVRRDVRIEALRRYSVSEMAAIKDGERWNRRAREKSLIDGGIKARENLLDRLKVAEELPICDHGVEALKTERILLLTAWWSARHLDLKTLRDLDCYLTAKGLFLQEHQQFPGRNPGLNRFRDILDRSRPLSEGSLQRKSNKAQKKRRFRRLIGLVAEPEHLTRLELRIAPCDSVRAYVRFFRLWERLLETGRNEFFAGKSNLNVGFIIHFIRDPGDAIKPGRREHFGKLKAELDRKSAILHLFRCNFPKLARHIVGIDVANKERGCPPDVLAPYLMLLRGRFELPASTDQADQEISRHWRRLWKRGIGRHPITLPRLGLTYHVGEDFYHPIDGIRYMHHVRENLMRPGDRIGHGLAAGIDVRSFHERRGRSIPIPRGVLLDNLVWVLQKARALDHPCLTTKLRRELDRAILRLWRKIYVRGERDPSTLFDLLARRYDRFGERDIVTQPVDRFYDRELFDPEVWRQRAEVATDKESLNLYNCSDLSGALQENLIKDLRDDGITVEFNPSSNIATGAISDMTEHPYFRYQEVLGEGSIATFNTDDPGVFATRVDLEYGLMLEAMLDDRRSFDREKALKLLEQARDRSISSSFVN